MRAGRQTRITWPNETFYAGYEYDVAGGLTAVRENGAASGPGVLALYVYDNLGRRVSVTRGNGVVTNYAYDSASRLDVLTHNLSGTGSDVALDFAHNAAGQILSRDRTSANGSYVHPQPGRNLDAYASNGLNAQHFGHLQRTDERQLPAMACSSARGITDDTTGTTWPFIKCDEWGIGGNPPQRHPRITGSLFLYRA